MARSMQESSGSAMVWVDENKFRTQLIKSWGIVSQGMSKMTLLTTSAIPSAISKEVIFIELE